MSVLGFQQLSDRELLLVIAEKQDSHLIQHKILADKVSNIEGKIIEDLENRLRKLEDEKNRRQGAYQFWLIVLGIATFANTMLAIYKASQ